MNFLKNTGLKNKKTYIKAYNYLQNGKFEESLRLFNYLLDENYRSFSILFNLITIHNELNSLGIYWMFSTELFKTKRDVKRKIKQFYLGVENFVIITIKIKCW